MGFLIRFGLILSISVLGCGGQSTTNSIASIIFTPDPVVASSQSCNPHAVVAQLLDTPVTLVSLTANFMDANKKESILTQDTNMLATEFDSIVVPGRGAVEGDVAFDLSSAALTFPVDANVVIIGSGQKGTTQFVGQFQCEGP